MQTVTVTLRVEEALESVVIAADTASGGESAGKLDGFRSEIENAFGGATCSADILHTSLT